MKHGVKFSKRKTYNGPHSLTTIRGYVVCSVSGGAIMYFMQGTAQKWTDDISRDLFQQAQEWARELDRRAGF